MAQTTNGAQQKTFRARVRAAFNGRRAEIRSISALARKLGRPRTSVSRAVNQGIFPVLRKQIEKTLKIS